VFRQLEEKIGAQPLITDARKQMSKTTTWHQVKQAVQNGNMVLNLVHGVQALYTLAVQ
jgi:hypothetical protein